MKEVCYYCFQERQHHSKDQGCYDGASFSYTPIQEWTGELLHQRLTEATRHFGGGLSNEYFKKYYIEILQKALDFTKKES